MRKVYARYGDDLDVAALFAKAIMNRTPWQLLDIATSRPAEGADTLEAIAVLEKAMRAPGGDRHPGVLHSHVQPHALRFAFLEQLNQCLNRSASALASERSDLSNLINLFVPWSDEIAWLDHSDFLIGPASSR